MKAYFTLNYNFPINFFNGNGDKNKQSENNQIVEREKELKKH